MTKDKEEAWLSKLGDRFLGTAWSGLVGLVPPVLSGLVLLVEEKERIPWLIGLIVALGAVIGFLVVCLVRERRKRKIAVAALEADSGSVSPSPEEMRMLVYLLRNGEMTCEELEAGLGLKPDKVDALVSGLMDAGLIRNSVDAIDAGTKLYGLEITSEGRSVAEPHRDRFLVSQFQIRTAPKHGHNTSAGKGPEYTVWDSMIQRCTNPNSKAWSYYGGRGIIVHDSWLNSFSKFLSDVGQRPSNKHTIDRIDNNRSYEPGNVRWATRKEQQRNRRCNLMISHEGETLCLTDWAQRAGISPSALKGRLKIMPISEAISKPHRVIRMRPV